MYDDLSIAILIATLDGHNPKTVRDDNGNITANPDGGESDLDILIHEKLTDVHPAVALRQLARATDALVYAVADELDGSGFEVNRREIADYLRRFLLTVRASDAE